MEIVFVCVWGGRAGGTLPSETMAPCKGMFNETGHSVFNFLHVCWGAFTKQLVNTEP